MGEVEKSSSVAYLSSPYAISAANRTHGSSVKLEETPYLSLSVLEEAENRMVKNVQYQAFPEEFASPDSSKNPLAKLKPFLNEGLLRVGGRLDRADLEYDAKHPMISTGKHQGYRDGRPPLPLC